jgi:alpha-tubulin suppressor-like RCC1 family protein
LWAWGRNGSGQLGQNDTTSRSSPVQVGALTTWSTVGAGLDFCLAIKSDRTLWSWGNNTLGRLGLNNTVSRSSPVQVGALTKWLRTSQGSRASHALAIKTP